MAHILFLILFGAFQLAQSNPCCYLYGNDDQDNRICSSNGHWVHNKCWFDSFNYKHHAALTVVANSECPNETRNIACRCMSLYNPICALNRVGGTKETFHNPCSYSCLQDAKDWDFLHCGPCDSILCDDIIENLNCISGPQPPCAVNSTSPIKDSPIAGSCDPNNNSGRICGRDTGTGNMKTYGSECELELAKKVNPKLDSLYHTGEPGDCPCI